MKNIISLFLLLIVCACGRMQNTNLSRDAEVAKKVESLLNQMTLKEKIAQMTQDAPVNQRLNIPEMNYSEGLHGLWKNEVTVYPQAIACASTWDPKLIKKMASQTAQEARALNITHCYSPNLDVMIGDARYGRVEEMYGEDPYLVSRLGVAFIEGMQGVGDERFDKYHVISTAKHFVGYSENRRGINGGFVDMSERRLRQIFLPPFEAAVKEAHVGCIMPAHEDFNGIPCHMNTWLLKDILRDELGFDGFIISDNTDIFRLGFMHHISKNKIESAFLSLKAGVDMDLVLGKSQETSTYSYRMLKDTIENNPSLEKYIDNAVARILTAKYELGLFDSKTKEIKKNTIVSTREHQDFAYKMAQKAVILLKNDNNLLPLDMSKIKSLAVIGPNAEEKRPAKGTYSLLGGYSGLPPYYVSVLDGLKKKTDGKIKINYAKSCDLLSDSKAGFSNAVSAAKKSDVVVLVVGGSSKTCREGVDRSDLNLYGVQNELVEAINKTGKPIIVVLINGRPLSINYIANNIPSILETWYLGMHSGDAIADAIFGDINPGGKLTVSFPRSVGQIPVTYLMRPDFPGTGKGQYRFSDKSPLFPFGYGLSYTTFKYSEPKLKNANIKPNGSTIVSVDVSNIGYRDGDEIVNVPGSTTLCKDLSYIKRLL